MGISQNVEENTKLGSMSQPKENKLPTKQRSHLRVDKNGKPQAPVKLEIWKAKDHQKKPMVLWSKRQQRKPRRLTN